MPLIVGVNVDAPICPRCGRAAVQVNLGNTQPAGHASDSGGYAGCMSDRVYWQVSGDFWGGNTPLPAGSGMPWRSYQLLRVPVLPVAPAPWRWGWS